MIVPFTLLFVEKLITSGSRFGLIFFVLGSTEKTIANDFFHTTSAVTLLITLCHLGTDTLIIGKEIKGENTNQIYFIRFISLLIAVLLLLLLFKFNLNLTTYLALVFALLGASLPLKQLKALSSTNRKKILIDRTAPEITCGLFRIIGMTTGALEADILIILFFAPEIIYGLFNSAFLIANRAGFKFFNLINFEREVSYSIFWSAITIFSLYGLQRGDILLITSNSESLTASAAIIIKYQQFFDMSGLLTVAGIPLIKDYIKNNKSPIVLIILSGALGATLLLIALESFSLNNLLSNLVKYTCGDLSFYNISIIFGLGLITYASITYFSLIAKHKLISLLMISCLAFKALCFTLLLRYEYIISYSFASAIFLATAFILAIFLNKSDQSYKQKLK